MLEVYLGDAMDFAADNIFTLIATLLVIVVSLVFLCSFGGRSDASIHHSRATNNAKSEGKINSEGEKQGLSDDDEEEEEDDDDENEDEGDD